MRNVLFVINTLGQGGAEVAMMQLMKKLQENDCTIDLYVMINQGELVHRLPEGVNLLNKDYDDTDVLSSKGKRHIALRLLRYSFKNNAFLHNLPYIFRNYRNMKKNNAVDIKKLLWKMISENAPVFDKEYDLAISFLEGASAYYTARHVKANAKCVFIHIDYELIGYNRMLDEDCFDHFDRIFTVSDVVKESFIHMYPEHEDKTMVFHNIIDQEGIIARSRLDGGFEDDYSGTRILTVARLVDQKRLDVSIEACGKLIDEGYDIRWYVLGEGDQRKALSQLIEKNGLNESFLLLGVKSNPYPYYAKCDLYVHCTQIEGKSIAIQEAMTLGCPVIVSDCSGNRDQVLDKENGLIVRFEVDEIVKAIKQLIDDRQYARRLGENAAKVVLTSEDMPKILELL